MVFRLDVLVRSWIRAYVDWHRSVHVFLFVNAMILIALEAELAMECIVGQYL